MDLEMERAKERMCGNVGELVRVGPTILLGGLGTGEFLHPMPPLDTWQRILCMQHITHIQNLRNYQYKSFKL